MADSGDEVQESRGFERFLIEPPLAGAFGGSTVDILDLAEKGLRAQHRSPMRPGTAGALSFRLPGTPEPTRLGAQIVWCRLSPTASPDGKLLYLSGLRFDEAYDSLQQSIEMLLRGNKARRDVDSLEKKRSKASRKISKASGSSPTMKVIRQHRRIDEDTLLLVKQAWSLMKQNPVEATKWYNKAKYALKEGDAPLLLHHKDDVLAIWEYLERSVTIDIIEWVLDNEHLM